MIIPLLLVLVLIAWSWACSVWAAMIAARIVGADRQDASSAFRYLVIAGVVVCLVRMVLKRLPLEHWVASFLPASISHNVVALLIALVCGLISLYIVCEVMGVSLGQALLLTFIEGLVLFVLWLPMFVAFACAIYINELGWDRFTHYLELRDWDALWRAAKNIFVNGYTRR